MRSAQVAAGAGMVPCMPALTPPALPAYVSISLDGRLIGYIQSGCPPLTPCLLLTHTETGARDMCLASFIHDILALPQTHARAYFLLVPY